MSLAAATARRQRARFALIEARAELQAAETEFAEEQRLARRRTLARRRRTTTVDRDQRDLEWLELSEHGMSASEIAHAFDTTRGVVIGRLWRIRRELD